MIELLSYVREPEIEAQVNQNQVTITYLRLLFQITESNNDADDGICALSWPNNNSTLKQMTDEFLQAAKTHFQSSSVVEITIETAEEFASTANNTVTSLTHLHSITSTVQSLNIKRADPRVTHELFTMKLNASKPQQSGTFVIEHQNEKSAILRRKIVIPYKDVLGMQISERKIILDTHKRPQTFYKKKDEADRQCSATWSECCEGFGVPGPGDNIRIDIQFNQPNTIVNALIQSEIHLQKAMKEGLREKYNRKSQEIVDPEAFFPIAKDPKTVRAAQLAVLELLEQPEGRDISWLIKMFGGIQRQFKQSLSESIYHVPVSFVEKEE